MNQDEFKFDFIVHTDKVGMIEKYFLELGANVYHVTPKHQSILKNYKDIKKVIQEGNYDIIHCHQNEYSFIPLYLAKKHNIPKIIMHSHNANVTQPIFKKIRKNIFAFLGKVNATNFLACTKMAGEWLFGKSFFKKNGHVLYNAFDIEKYQFDKKIRIKLIKEYNLENKFVIGNIGRMCYQKNHEFLIEIFKECLNLREDAHLLLIGDGELKESIEKQAQQYEISDKISFLGVKNNVGELLNVMDIFCFPTRFEGLGMVIVESQTNGLPICMSDAVPNEAIILSDIVSVKSLKDSPKEWAQSVCEINKKRESNLKIISKSGYNIAIEAKKLEEIYKR